MLNIYSLFDADRAMKNFVYEMQGLTWRGESYIQQDAILIGNKVIQHDGLISESFCLGAELPWCVAVADGLASSANAEKASVAVLEAVRIQQQNRPTATKDLKQVQLQLCRALAENQTIDAASSTLALVQNSAPEGYVYIQHLGNSRIYHFSHAIQQWRAITIDHTYFETLRSEELIDKSSKCARISQLLTSSFCADWQHEVSFQRPQEYLIDLQDVLLVCTNGVHAVVDPQFWPSASDYVLLRDWLLEMKNLLQTAGPYDNASMVMIRLNYKNHNKAGGVENA